MVDPALIQEIAKTFYLDAELLAAQIQQESGRDPYAFRYEPTFFARYVRDNPKALAKAYGPLAACSYGLLQIILETAYEEGFTGRPEELFDARTGLTWGAKKLQRLLTWANGDYPQALAAYNAGMGNWESTAGQTYAALVTKRVGRPLA